MVENKKKPLVERDLLKDDFLFEEPNNLSNTEKDLEEDTEFIEFLRDGMAYPVAPERIIEKAMQGYKKHYRYRIIWRNIKTKVEEWTKFLPLNSKMGKSWAVAVSIVLVLTACYTLYYQYQTSKNVKPVDLTSNKQLPAVDVTPRPVPTPQVTLVPTPSIAENNSVPTPTPSIIKRNNDNKIEINNNQKNEIAKNKQTADKPIKQITNKPTTETKDKFVIQTKPTEDRNPKTDDIAHSTDSNNTQNPENVTPNNDTASYENIMRTPDNKDNEDISKNSTVEVRLETIRTVYIGQLTIIHDRKQWISEFCKELKSKMQGYWLIKDDVDEEEGIEGEDINKPDAALKLDTNENFVLKILKGNNLAILWSSNVKVGVGDPKTAASIVADDLIKTIRNASDKLNDTNERNIPDNK